MHFFPIAPNSLNSVSLNLACLRLSARSAVLNCFLASGTRKLLLFRKRFLMYSNPLAMSLWKQMKRIPDPYLLLKSSVAKRYPRLYMIFCGSSASEPLGFAFRTCDHTRTSSWILFEVGSVPSNNCFSGSTCFLINELSLDLPDSRL